MASEKQIAANRANAKKSSGPKTAAGKLKSSRNARRHGLSTPMAINAAASAEAAALARSLAQGSLSAAEPAMGYAQAYIELKRVRDERNRLLAAFDVDQPDLRSLRRIAALDRYERYQFTKLRRAACDLRKSR